jgi:hypothetical protein
MARIFGTVNLMPNLAPSWNAAPTQSGPRSPGLRRSPPRYAAVGFAAAPDEGTDQGAVTDQRALIRA